MTKAEQDSLILDALELAIKTARVFYPETKHISVVWIDSEEGEYLQVNNPYYDIEDNTKKLYVYRRDGEDVNDFPN